MRLMYDAVTLHGIQPVIQPSPAVNAGGDCFACASLALVRHFWPAEAAGVTVADVVEWWRTQPVYGKDELHLGNSQESADRSIRGFPEPFRFDVHTDPFVPTVDSHHQPYSPIWWPTSYDKRVEAYLAAGWVGFINILFAPEAPHFLKPKPEGGYWNAGPDHNVLLDGIRTYVEGNEIDGKPYGTHVTEVHIVCSVKGGYWIDSRELLRNHGGMFIWWARPKRDLPWVAKGSTP